MTEMLNITNETKLGELVIYFPEITQMLNELHVDYCCQGDRTLDKALNQQQIEEIKTRYQAYLSREKDDTDLPSLNNDDLIHHIIQTHHITERKLWLELDPLINKIMVVHYDHDKDRLLKLHHTFATLRMELEEHFAKEEEELFPLIQQTNEAEEIKRVIAELEGEHDNAGKLLKELEEITNHFVPEAYACPTVKLVYTKLHQLVDDIYMHVATENSLLFKRF